VKRGLNPTTLIVGEGQGDGRILRERVSSKRTQGFRQPHPCTAQRTVNKRGRTQWPLPATRYDDDDTDQAVGIPGYNIFRKDRGARRGGGVEIYVPDHIQSRVYSPAAVIDDRFELLWITAQLNGNVLYIGALYHPPITSKLQ